MCMLSIVFISITASGTMLHSVMACRCKRARRLFGEVRKCSRALAGCARAIPGTEDRWGEKAGERVSGGKLRMCTCRHKAAEGCELLSCRS